MREWLLGVVTLGWGLPLIIGGIGKPPPSCFLLTGSQALMNEDKQYQDYLLAWKSEERKGSNNPQDSTALRSLLVRWDFKTLDSGHSESFWRSSDYSGILKDRLNSIEWMPYSCSRFCKQYWIPPPPNLSVCWSEERFPGSAANSREGREGGVTKRGGRGLYSLPSE